MRAPPRSRRPVVLGIALAVSLLPARALANPGPDPLASIAFFFVFVAQLALSVLAVTAARRDDSRGSPLLAYSALCCTLLGVGSCIGWEASAMFQVPATLFLVLALLSTGRSELKTLGVVAGVAGAITLGWAIDRARHPRFALFAASANALGGDESNAHPPSTAMVQRRTIKNFGPDPDAGAVAGADAALPLPAADAAHPKVEARSPE
jgi:hypothetical protein